MIWLERFFFLLRKTFLMKCPAFSQALFESSSLRNLCCCFSLKNIEKGSIVWLGLIQSWQISSSITMNCFGCGGISTNLLSSISILFFQEGSISLLGSTSTSESIWKSRMDINHPKNTLQANARLRSVRTKSCTLADLRYFSKWWVYFSIFIRVSNALPFPDRTKQPSLNSRPQISFEFLVWRILMVNKRRS